MNTAGGNEPRCHGDDHWWPVKKGETAPRYGDWCECGQAQFFPSHARDPSVRDVLAQLDRIETKLDALMKQLEPKPLHPGYHGQYGSVPCG